MDDAGGERRRKGDAFPTSSSSRALGLLPSPSGSTHLPSQTAAAAAAIVLALPTSRASVASPGAGLLSLPRLAGAMDGGGGEALLVRRSKGKKKPPLPPAAERESGGGGRFRALWRDYHDLLEETEAKKRGLDSMHRRKLRLLAEIKFLRRKHESFVKGNSQRPHYRLKRQAQQNPSPVGSNEFSAISNHGVGTEVPSTSKNTNFDLNQDTAMNGDGVDCQGHENRSELVKFDQVGADEDGMATDAKLSVCRDTGNSPASDDKRTIPWQDRLALKA